MTTDFGWKRFWCPRGKNFDLSDRGFLTDPDAKWGKYSNADLVTFQRLAALPCAVMLGEPGIGKTWTLKREYADAERLLAADAKSMICDLRSFSTDGHLVAQTFESETFQSWRKGDWILHVYLDSLDECLLRLDNVASILADELLKQPVERLRLRVACRTASWPEALGETLRERFGSCNAHELVPLRRIDVERAAKQSGIEDPPAFLSRIDDLDISSLAIKPVTLGFLIRTFLQNGDLPKNHLDLYEKGCRILVEENNPNRLSSGRTGSLNPDERLTIASRVAAVTQLCSRFAVFTGSEVDNIPAEDVPLNELSGGVERAVDKVNVSTKAVWEVLDTGLFSSRGVGRFGWAHQTYAEFLAARYCTRRRMPIAQIRSLIFHPSDQGQRLIPQLYEVAAWMSVMDSEVLKAVAASDPEALLGAAAASLADEHRRLIVDSLLQQTSAGRRLDLRWGLYWLYPKLKHAGLADQLRPYLGDANHGAGARHVAISIARACKVSDVGSALADIALDRSADLSLRVSAAAAAAEAGSVEVRARLRPLAFGEGGEDPQHELKGSGLRAIWPELISASEMFPLLTPPVQGLSGTYSRFLYEDVIPKAKAEDLPAALEWFAQRSRRLQMTGPLDNLMDQIVRFAWSNIEAPGVASGLAKAVLSRLPLYDEILSRDEDREFARKVNQEHERRRVLLKELLPQLTLNGATRITLMNVPLLAPSDVDWLIDRALCGDAKESEPVEARLVRLAFNWEDRDSAAKLWSACQSNQILNAECGPLFICELNSEEVKAVREEFKQQKEWSAPKLLSPTPLERVASDLDKIESGDVAYWVQLIRDLTLELASSHYADDAGPNLRDTPGWKAAQAGTRKRILDAAARYLHEGDPENDKWFQTQNLYYSAIGGFRALALLMVVEDVRLDLLKPDVWAKWVPILLKFPYSGNDRLKLQERLLRRAHEVVSAESVKWILALIDDENARSGHFFIAKEVDACWDEHLGTALLEKAKSLSLTPSIFASIVELLLRHDFPGTRDFAESQIAAGLSGSEPERQRAIASAAVLARCTSDAGWKKVWPVITENEEIGRRIVESISFGNLRDTSFVAKLSEADLGGLYLWMVEAYPYAEHRIGFGAVGPGDSAAMFRDGLLESLKKKATFAAVDALRHVSEKLPQYTWLRFQLEQAEELARAGTWNPVSIRKFLALAADRDKRFVDTGSQLIEALMESLDRLNLKLHDELPAVRDIWNTYKGEFSPKEEQEVADYVVRHLRDDLRGRGIIVNREVQIRRGTGDGSGQRTDIYVDAVAPGREEGSLDHVCAIVEVKGNWNAELNTAMETQLRDRYLKENHCNSGLYLIAWFASTKWSSRDWRKRQCPRTPLAEGRDSFIRQAASLSSNGLYIRSYVLDSSLS